MNFKKLFLLSTLSMLLCMGCGTANAEPREAAVEAWEELSDSEEDIPITWEEIPNTEEDIADTSTDVADNSSQVPEESLGNDMAKLLIPPVKVKGIYVTGPAAGSERMEQLIDLVSSTELNTMVIDVKNDEGNLTYKMEVPASANLEAGIRYVKDMPALVERLHQQGIYVIARIVCFKDPVLAAARPELALRLPDGKAVMDANGLAWVNPYKEEVWDYLIDLSKQAAALGFDEIQYDYIRFSTAKGIAEADFGAESEGKTTVRLHTGDPSIYGAIREQMDALDARGYTYDVTPGVSSFCGAAAALKAEYDEKLKNIEKEAESILGEARKKGLSNQERIINEAKEEAAKIIEFAKQEAELEKKKAADEVKKEIIMVSTLMANKVIAASIDANAQEELINDTLREIGDSTWLS